MARLAALVVAAALLLACGAGLMPGADAASATTPASKYVPVEARAYINTKLCGTYLKGANATKGFGLNFPSLPPNVK
jgi:hypothetical protein